MSIFLKPEPQHDANAKAPFPSDNCICKGLNTLKGTMSVPVQLSTPI